MKGLLKLLKTLDVLEYYEPKYWIIENPQTGLLKDQLCMYGLPFKDVDYCRYGVPYRKRTRLWNNIFSWNPRPLCKRDFGSMNETRTRHKAVAQKLPPGKNQSGEIRCIFQLLIYIKFQVI